MEFQEHNTKMDTSEQVTLPHQEPTNTPTPSFLGEVIKFAIIAALIVVPIRLFVAQPFIVSGASMEPTFQTGEYLIVDQLTYAFEAPNRGEVVIFRYPEDPSKFFIKRIVGLPGETVRLQGENVIIENREHPTGFILNETYLDPDNLQSAHLEVELAHDEYFVLGDNRGESSDSRAWGPLKEKFLIGRAFFRLFPLLNDNLLPGSVSDKDQ